MRLVFSIPVHEKTDVVADLVRNVLRYNPDSTIVLHVSRLFADFDAGQLSSFPNLVVNPRRYLTQHGKGLLLCHCSNFRHLLSMNMDFDEFCLLSSNEMFVRSGLADYIKTERNGFQAVRFDLKKRWHLFNRRVDLHPKIQALLKELGTVEMVGGQAEGQFFDKAVFSQICDLYFSVFGETEINDFETEEVVPQTVASALGVQPALPFTLVDYTHPLDFQFTEKNIALLADPRLVGHVRLNLGQKGRETLVSPHFGKTNSSVFSVKRVPREISHPLRDFINQLPANQRGSQAQEELQNKVQSGVDIPLVSDLRWKQLKRLPQSIRAGLRIRTRIKRAVSHFRAIFRGGRNAG